MKKKKVRKPGQLYYHLLLLPGVLFVFLFGTRTWIGILGAFEDYIPTLGYFHSPWVGLRNFEIFFKQPTSLQIIRNTLVIAIGKIVCGQAAAILFALILNEVRGMRFKKTVQTAVYLPHFISWVIYATILKSILGTGGLFNHVQDLMGAERTMFLGNPATFPWIMILTQTLKEFGYGAIIYLSAIAAVDQGLYEAARVDGANRLQLAIHVTLPGIRYIIILNALLSLGSILNAGFDQIFNMYNQLVMSTGDIMDTWIYRQGLVNLNYGVGTAVGLFRSVIGMVLTILAYWAADRFADYKIF